MRAKNAVVKISLLALCCLLLALVLCSCAVNGEPLQKEDNLCTIPSDSIRFKIPADSFVFARTSNPYTEDWALAGIASPSEAISDYKNRGILANIVSMGGKHNVNILSKQSQLSASTFNLTTADASSMQALQDDILSINETEGFSVTADQKTVNGILYMTAEVRYTPGEDDDREPMHEFCYVTILNGSSYSFDTYVAGRDLNEEDRAYLDEIVNSVEFLDIKDNTITEPTTADYLRLGAFVLIIAALIVFLIVFPSVRRKRQKRERDELSERLSAYRTQQKEQEAAGIKDQSKTLFVNKTVHTDANLQQFSYFHAYKKILFTLPGFIFSGALSVLFAILLLRDGSYIWALLFAAAGIYCIVKVFLIPGQHYRTLQRIYKGLPNRVALYAFREEDFRLSGLQATGVFPYFQLYGVYESKDKFYLYFNEDNAYIMDKNTFSYGEANEFRTFIREKVGKRYHRRTL